MQIFQFCKALDQWEHDLYNPDQWECSTLPGSLWSPGLVWRPARPGMSWHPGPFLPQRRPWPCPRVSGGGWSASCRSSGRAACYQRFHGSCQHTAGSGILQTHSEHPTEGAQQSETKGGLFTNLPRHKSALVNFWTQVRILKYQKRTLTIWLWTSPDFCRCELNEALPFNKGSRVGI